MTHPSIQNILYYGTSESDTYPESLLILYEKVMKKMKVDTMTSKEQSIVILELAETIRNRFQQKNPNIYSTETEKIKAYCKTCSDVLTELL